MVEFRILGALNLLGADGGELRAVLAQPKRVALLAYLAAGRTREFRRRDSLLALFWPELDQEHARAALRQALHGLRQSLGSGALASRGDDEIGLAPEELWCDLRAFHAAIDAGRNGDALELYRGDLLEGFFLSGAPDFERWLEDERAASRRRAVEAAWTLAESCRDAGDLTLASHWARRAAALARDDEGALRRLIALLGGMGDRAGALHAYDSFARRLAEEYDAEPAAETRALIAHVRSHENAIEVQRPMSAGHGGPPEIEAPPEPELAGAPSVDVDRPTTADVPPLGARRRRVTLTVGALATLAAVTLGSALLWGRGTPQLDPSRVVVAEMSNRTGDPGLDAVGELARAEIMRGLELTEVVEIADPVAQAGPGASRTTGAVPVGEEAAAARSLAIATRSGLAVWGAMYPRGNEIEFAAHVVDVERGRVLRTLEPVRGDRREPRPALMLLRDRIMAVVAESVDPRIAASASAVGNPPLYDAYTEFIKGVAIWYDLRNGREALPHFKRAASLDSSFALPLIWAAWVHQTFGQCDSTEAIAKDLRRLRLSRVEQLQIERQMHRCRGDLPGAYRVAHALADARPSSELWHEQLARDALDFNRPREAVQVLERLHPERGALRGRVSYYNFLTAGHHLLRQHERELEVARHARSRFPGNLAAVRTEFIALAALGRGREVTRRLGEIGVLPPDPIRKPATVLREISLDLAAHGDSAAAREALRYTLAWHADRPPAEQATEHLRFERALTHHAAGQADDARTIAAELARIYPERDEYAGLLGVLAARRGDSAQAAGVDRRLAELERPYGRGQTAYWRACIAAQLGRRDQAVELLRRALAEGYVFNGLFFLNAHLEPSFAVLRGYPPFEELLRPRG